MFVGIRPSKPKSVPRTGKTELLIRAGHALAAVAERREALIADARQERLHEYGVDLLREDGWRTADIEAVLERRNLTPLELAAGRPRPEDFGFQSVPCYGGGPARGALSLAPDNDAGALSLSSPATEGASSLVECDRAPSAPNAAESQIAEVEMP